MGNNAKLYFDWMVGKPIESLVDYINNEGNDLNGRKLARTIGIGEASLRQNPEIIEDLKKLKERMGEAGLLTTKGSGDSAGDSSEGQSRKDTIVSGLTRKERMELDNLRVQVVSLKEENRSLKEALVRYEKMEEYLAEFGVLPR